MPPQILIDLLDHPSEERVEAYGIKRQLISLRSLKFKLDHFPINTIKECLIQTKKIKERIADITLTLQTLKKELKSTLDLFIEPFNDYEDVRKGRLFLAELEKIEGEFEAVLAQYKDQAIPTLEQLGQITSVQRDIVIKLEGLHQKLKGEKNFYKETLDLTSHLASQYHLSLINLRYNLRQSFQNTRVVLSAYLRLPAEMKNEGVLERAQATLILLDTMRQELCAETRENRPLATIHRENQLAIQDFEQHGQIPREILAIAYQKILADLMQRAALPLPTLEQRNSIANGLISQKEAALSAIEAAKSAYTTLTTSNQQCVASLSAFAQADSALVAFEKSVQQASIEDRKRSKHYLKSLEIIKVIQEEYFRILKKYFDQACENNPDEIANFVKLKEKRWTRNAFHAHADRFTDLLDKIDPRLCRLLSLQFGYERLNEKYLNGNFLKSAQIKCNEKALASTEQRLLQAEQHLYKNQLIKTVEDTLHNESMEYISEGIRSDFVQWIRIHVLKPLQYLLTYCFVPNSFFTPTWRACRTEEFLVEAGNQFYNELTDNPGF
ncbi:hypothetical protein [Legionella maceachernii]|uniref:Uncharacterized protein n=1 Tax=Legionella maceachernii TaxID=466 RepID=A0A0W0WG51_9GAMM|nr:hypothetical protein [Legionella maceachernii]KTD31287.1 hypothetical protein Lmac_0341 [Legionella maceachernii]SKA00472.1 hypothetical protein SAMN02745128_01747 [Legionella maceachernii]SUP01340.1 Uncharacterised protein [Legionella maceachernii]